VERLVGKRGSGAPRHPRSPVAKAVRTPTFRMRVVPEGYQRWSNTHKDAEQNAASDAESKQNDRETDPDKD
jgi:hypothetical protein